jgi:hypothetical protein
MCEYSKEEFTAGLAKLGVDSADRLKAKLKELRAEASGRERARASGGKDGWRATGWSGRLPGRHQAVLPHRALVSAPVAGPRS